MLKTVALSVLLTMGVLLPAASAAVIESAEIVNPGAYPVFKRAEANPAFALKVNADSEEEVNAFQLTFKVNNPAAISEIRLRAGDNKGLSFEEDVVLAAAKPSKKGIVKLTCKKGAPAGFLWIDVQPSERATVGGLISFSDFELKSKEGKVELDKDMEITQRIGYMLGVPGEKVDGRECKSFRIPGLICTDKGTLVGCFDARYLNEVDLCGDIDVAVVRSTDGGQTWSKPSVAMDSGPGTDNGCGDPCILQDTKTGRIWLQALACHFDGGMALRKSKPGLKPEETGQWEMVYSDNDGKSWSKKPKNVTEDVKQPEWTLYFAGPGNGITLKDGTLVFPSQFWVEMNPQSTICYSKDNGKTWKTGGSGVPHPTSECQIVELNDGSIMINCRNEARSGKRAVYVTKDLGDTWEPHETNLKALQEPTCQASIIRAKTAEGDLLLFSNPKSGGRNRMTIRYSKDEGKTWSDGYQYDVRASLGYSCLAMVDENTVGVIYETSHRQLGEDGLRGMSFLSFPLESILTGETLPVTKAQKEKDEKKNADEEADKPKKEKKKKEKKAKRKKKKAK